MPYTNQLKQNLLGVPVSLLEDKGAVSAEVAVAMAKGARERLGTDYALSITGIAGPGGEGTSKPAGLTFVGLAGPELLIVRQFNWSGDRWENRRLSVRAALRLLVDSLTEVGA